MKTSILLIIERYSKVASGAIYIFLLAKFLGPEKYGVYSANLALVGIIGVFSFAGVDSLFQKKLSENEDFKAIFSSFFIIKSLPVLLALIIYILWSFFSISNDRELFVYFSPVLFSLTLSFSYQGLVYVREFKKIYIVSFSIIIISNAFRFYLFYYNPDIKLFALSYSFEALAYPLGYSFQFFWKSGFVLNKNRHRLIKSILIDGWPLILSTMLIGIVPKLALLKIESGKNMEEVGQFALMLRIVEALLILAVASSMFGLKELLVKIETEQYIKTKHKYMMHMYFLSISCSLISFMLFYLLIPILFGDDYIYSLTSSLAISLLVFFNFIGIYNGRLLVVEGVYKFALMRNAASFVCFISLCAFLSDDFNIEIAILVLFFSWFISSFVFMLFSQRTRRMVFFER
jgi:O-antigen/teichoic acid export membrane protein